MDPHANHSDHVIQGIHDVNVGMTLHDRGEFEHALSHFAGAATVFRNHKEEEHLADCLFNQAMSLSALGRFREAEVNYTASLFYFEAHEAHGQAAFAHRNQGNAHQRANRPDDAVASYRAARNHFATIDMHDEAWSSLAAEGNIHRDENANNDAVACYESALTGLSERAALETADTRHNLAIVLTRLGQFGRARKLLGEAIGFYSSAHLDQKIASSTVALARIAESEHDYRDAIDKFSKARDLLSAEGTPSEVAGVSLELGKSYLELDDADQAIVEFDKARRLYSTAPGSEVDAAVCGMMLGNAHHSVSRFAEAKGLYDDSLVVFESTGSRAHAADCEFNIGNLYLNTGRPAAAEASYARAGAYYAAENKTKDTGDFHRGLAMALWSRGDYDNASKELSKAREVFEALELPMDSAMCMYDETALLHAQGQNVGAFAILVQMRPDIVKSGDARMLALWDARAGVILSGLGRHRESLSAATAARDYSEATNDPVGVAKHEVNRGIALKALGELDEAETVGRRAKELLAQFGSPDDIATCDVNLGLLYETRSRSEPDTSLSHHWLKLALSLIVPAALLLDARRFDLSTARDRQLWTERRSMAVVAIALRIAEDLDDVDTIAALVIDARANGTYVAGGLADSELEDSVARGGDGTMRDRPQTALPPQPAFTASGALCRVLGSDQWALGPSPLVQLPNGWTALEQQIVQTEGIYGIEIRADAMVRAYG